MEERITYIKDSEGKEELDLFELTKVFTNGLVSVDGESVPNLMAGCATGLRIKGKLNLDKVEKAIQMLFDNIDGMRAVVDRELEIFRIRESYEYKMEVIVPEGNSPDEKFEKAKEECNKLVVSENFYDDCACRFRVYELGQNEYFLIVATNHLFGDGQSLMLIVKQMIELYFGIKRKVTINSKTMMDYYENWKKVKASAQYKENNLYWEKEKRGIENLYTFNPPEENNVLSDDMYTLEFDLRKLKNIAKKARTTVPNLAMTAYHMGFANVHKTAQSIITVAFANRMEMEYLDTFAPMVKLLINRVRFTQDMAIKELLRAVMQKTSETIKHSYIAKEYIGCNRYFFSYLPEIGGFMSVPGYKVEVWVPEIIDPSKYRMPFILCTAVEQNGKLAFQITCNREYYNKNDILLLREGISNLVNKLDENENALVGDVLR